MGSAGFRFIHSNLCTPRALTARFGQWPANLGEPEALPGRPRRQRHHGPRPDVCPRGSWQRGDPDSARRGRCPSIICLVAWGLRDSSHPHSTIAAADKIELAYSSSAAMVLGRFVGPSQLIREALHGLPGNCVHTKDRGECFPLLLIQAEQSQEGDGDGIIGCRRLFSALRAA